MIVNIFTDGSCKNNGKPNAIAGIGVYWGPDNTNNQSLRLPGEKQTNNRAELYAVIVAMKQLYKLCYDKNTTVTIYSDSKYVIDGINKWVPKWTKKEWLIKANTDLWEICFSLINLFSYPLNWIHVYGHTDNKGNIEADKLAVNATII